MSNLKRLLAGAGVVLGLVPALASAQQATTISGRVMSETGQPLQGAGVTIPSLNVGAYTQADGHYSFTVSAANTGRSVQLTARRIGSNPQTVTVTLSGGAMTQDFSLTTAPTQLTGVVVTALGIEREKRTLGVAQQTIDSSALTNGARTSNVVASLSGKIAGISVTSASTQGGSSRIVIRGATSIAGNNQPLFIVDGVPIDNSNYANGSLQAGNGGYDLGNTIQDINPDDIASLSVLKGPNAAALYGARAANGAIIITTKNGRGTRGFQVSASSNVSFESPLRLPEYQNTWGQGYQGDVCDHFYKDSTSMVLQGQGTAAGTTYPFNPATFNYAKCGFTYVDGFGGGVNDDVDESWGPRLDGTIRSQYSTTLAGTAQDRPWVAHAGNVESFFRTGRTTVTNAAVQGSNDKANYRLSLTRQDVAGMLTNNSLNRTTAALSGGAQVNARLNTQGSIQYVLNQGFNRPGTGYDEANPMMGFVWFGRQVDIAGLKNHYIDVNGDQISWNYSYHNNPWWAQYMNSNHDRRDRVLGQAAATYKFTDWLNAKLSSGTDFYRDFRTYEFAKGWIGGFGGDGGDYSQGGFQEANRFNQESNTEFLLTANRSFLTDLGVTVNLGGNRRVNRYRSDAFGTDKLVTPGVYNIANSAKPVFPSEYSSEKRVNSLYGQAEFGFRDFLFVTVTGRNDWSSTLPKGNNSYFYPSVSSSFVFTQALPMLTFGDRLDYGKLRASWSRVGNDTDPYQLIASYSALSAFGGIPRLSVANDLLNPALKPENTDAWEVGTELSAFDSRVGLDLTYYNKRTSNQILTADVSKASGFGTAKVNAGVISNRGIEAQLNLTPIRTSDGRFRWDVALNYGKNTNRVDSLYGNLQTVTLGPGHWYLSVEARKGYPYGAMFGVGFLRCGAYDSTTASAQDRARIVALQKATVACPTDGSANGQLLLSNTGLPQPEPSTAKRVLGVYTPDWTGGINNTFHYRGVEFGFLVDTRQGGNIYSTGNMWGSFAGILKNTEYRPDTGIVVQGYNRGTNAAGSATLNTRHVRTEQYFHSLYKIQEPWIYDASFVKLREARIGFDIPSRLLRTTTISNARLSIVGRNLALWTDAPNIDPETAFSATNLQGIEMGQLPTARSVGFQLSVTP